MNRVDILTADEAAKLVEDGQNTSSARIMLSKVAVIQVGLLAVAALRHLLKHLRKGSLKAGTQKT